MIIISCDWCGFSITEIAYTVLPIVVRTNVPLDGQNIQRHVHFECLPSYVKYMQGGPSPIKDRPLYSFPSTITMR